MGGDRADLRKRKNVMNTHIELLPTALVSQKAVEPAIRTTMKTLVLVHPGSLFGSAEFTIGRVARAFRDDIKNQILSHTGKLVVIDGYLSDEIDEEFEDAIHRGLCNALVTAHRAGSLDSVSAFRAWGCDSGEAPNEEWEGFGSDCLPRVFKRQETAAEFLCERLQTDEIEVTGAWTTFDGKWGCVNSVAEVLRAGLPGVTVKISETALFEEYKSRPNIIIPLFNQGGGEH